ncbi:DUF4396 domain-containing protein [Cellulosimicrobium arenosum]|uniref:DUF4396 domain-containing protein n=1 Tax=Cellulosimicrobium arenosum TaxID=2708133 RepID=A0A927G877_9MICO|nr:DUF4396 domain-containing protein [Cellulosimicrobium arenosum]MBD8078267.1 DUF4396 domain-containing protein [Cellulosimicrobium arenosum]
MTEQAAAPAPAFPGALSALATVSLVVAGLCALWVAVDVVRRPPRMRVMAVVWPLTMLFGSVVWLWFYLRWARTGRADDDADRPHWVSVVTSTSHCGAGCTLGDVVGEGLVLAVPGLATVAGYGWLFADEMYARWVVDLVLAFGFGIVLQYLAIAPMRGLSLRRGLAEAVTADTVSILSWQLGMYAAMALAQLVVLPAAFGGPAPVLSVEFWWIMQLAMLTGFATSYPANVWLVRRGVKEAM